MNPDRSQLDSPWPHRAAVLLVCATFPLIWVGGLVTTYEAGMAVPDWPTTFGYNLFLYPWQTWIAGPWDLFIEHGHRLFGAAVGLLTIALVVAAFRCDRRPWFRWMTLVALALVIFQGVLGGLRVRLDQRLLAQLHGCTGPAFFALSVALAVWTSRRWRDGPDMTPAEPGDRRAARFQRLVWLTTALAYVQLVLGSQLRHVRVEVDVSVFRAAVWLHLFMAAALAVHIALLSARSLRWRGTAGWLVRPAVCLGLLLVVQLALGGGAWVVNYGWPAGWFSGQEWAQGFVVAQESRTQAFVTTAHVATGSLILATALLVALRSLLLPVAQRTPSARLFAQEALA